jgi:hypothetical protein
LHTVFALAAIEDMEMESIDISNAYLNGVLKDVNVYMRQPEGFGLAALAMLRILIRASMD